MIYNLQKLIDWAFKGPNAINPMAADTPPAPRATTDAPTMNAEDKARFRSLARPRPAADTASAPRQDALGELGTKIRALEILHGPGAAEQALAEHKDSLIAIQRQLWAHAKAKGNDSAAQISQRRIDELEANGLTTEQKHEALHRANRWKAGHMDEVRRQNTKPAVVPAAAAVAPANTTTRPAAPQAGKPSLALLTAHDVATFGKYDVTRALTKPIEPAPELEAALRASAVHNEAEWQTMRRLAKAQGGYTDSEKYAILAKMCWECHIPVPGLVHDKEPQPCVLHPKQHAIALRRSKAFLACVNREPGTEFATGPEAQIARAYLRGNHGEIL